MTFDELEIGTIFSFDEQSKNSPYQWIMKIYPIVVKDESLGIKMTLPYNAISLNMGKMQIISNDIECHLVDKRDIKVKIKKR